ncbi:MULTISPECIES: DMT family transporter [unclassified Marichromatium]|uniref:DMT family transporter n=1 Tax=unclassified Marichromatium TaxID=2618417 RepID=UPI000F41D12D|nr:MULTISPECIES: DMT family transporter [unclassified Marichromatium]MBO8086043.1 DMT family transporter [Marichromatium sp.]RNE88926.1 DMT family transporter [Marichromatium sp. AB31]RNE91102.1 DMT family transporter [Marichromatium sp. AB32]
MASGNDGLARAAGWMGLALLSFAALAVSARESLAAMSPAQFLFLRTLLGLPLLVGLGVLLAPGFMRTRRWRLHLLRNLFHYGGQLCWIGAIGLLPLALVFALEFTTPVWAALLALVFLGERLGRGRLVALVAGLVGVLLITRPGLQPFDAGMALGLLAALGFAVTMVATKGLTRHDSVFTILFWMLTIQLLLGLPVALWVWQPIGWSELPWLLVAAVTGISAHLGVANAFRHADATLVLPMDFLRLPLIALVGALCYGEGLDPWVLGGGVLILAGNLYSLRRERRG